MKLAEGKEAIFHLTAVIIRISPIIAKLDRLADQHVPRTLLEGLSDWTVPLEHLAEHVNHTIAKIVPGHDHRRH